MGGGYLFRRTGRGLAIGAAILATAGLTTSSRPAHALSPGAGVGIGLGAFAAGTMLGAAANPYHNLYYYPYGSYSPAPAPAYTYSPPAYTYSPPAPAYTNAPAYDPPGSYYQSRNCGYPYSRRSYVC
jgi:hypothetical protein